MKNICLGNLPCLPCGQPVVGQSPFRLTQEKMSPTSRWATGSTSTPTCEDSVMRLAPACPCQRCSGAETPTATPFRTAGVASDSCPPPPHVPQVRWLCGVRPDHRHHRRAHSGWRVLCPSRGHPVLRLVCLRPLLRACMCHVSPPIEELGFPGGCQLLAGKVQPDQSSRPAPVVII